MNKPIIHAMTATVMGAALILVVAGHGPREPRFEALPLGKPMVMMPVSINTTQVPPLTNPEATGLHLTVHWEGAPIAVEDPAAVIRFYHKGESKPFYVTNWKELKKAYRSSGCTNDQIATLDGPLDAALICDNRLGRLSELGKIEALSPAENETKATEVFSTYQRAANVTALTVQLY